MSITYKGGGSKDDVNVIPPYPKDYSPRSLGPRPASGLYIRHVRNLTLKNVEFAFEQPDERPPIVAQDVDGLHFDGFKTEKPPDVTTFKLDSVMNFTLQNSPGLTSTCAAAAIESYYGN